MRRSIRQPVSEVPGQKASGFALRPFYVPGQPELSARQKYEVIYEVRGEAQAGIAADDTSVRVCEAIEMRSGLARRVEAFMSDEVVGVGSAALRPRARARSAGLKFEVQAVKRRSPRHCRGS